MNKLKILIVDDQKLFADSLGKVIRSEQDSIESVSIVNSGREALETLQDETADIILMDIHMPGMDGIELTRTVHKKYPSIKILMLTTFGYDDYVKDAMNYGAVGYLLKDISSEELLASIQGASQGLRIVSPKVLEGAYKIRRASSESQEIPDWYYQLTHREKEILILVQKGYSNDEIASQVLLSTQTVKNYLSTIYEKLEVKNRFQAMRLAMEYKVDTIPLR
ncbi:MULTISPECIES: response regulator transcription factor [unclassified Oceanispirochaeta]|uniref:response regulator transcription factor n=1 Tax=unclassified Oceanispirochaeta TaxID=2635722 RepID=UPI000E0920EB|nr:MULTISPECIES: response regulator transcription factor [unclassified Oceanispirochaeta]MBF9014255.1 response regulator transcription factor [Oceanispirochaeta sp. M2]NPD71141.1 response regulator transcription factor [Oceanispirochaeta sp. M1]RDG33535.1 DNA-binding response regulator [Oceanispirochaeta sp. M1]